MRVAGHLDDRQVSGGDPALRDLHVRRNQRALAEVFEGLRDEVLADGGFDFDVWHAELSETIFDREKDTATDFGVMVFESLRGRSRRFAPDLMDDYLDVVANHSARAFLDAASAAVQAASGVDEVAAVLDAFVNIRSGGYAMTMATRSAAFGAHEGARAAGAQEKIWVVTSPNPRDWHANMHGERAPLGGVFSNGLRWPGESGKHPREVANCMCILDFE